MQRHYYPFRHRVTLEIDVYSDKKDELGVSESTALLNEILGSIISTHRVSKKFDIIDCTSRYVDSIFDGNSKNNVLFSKEEKKVWWKKIFGTK